MQRESKSVTEPEIIEINGMEKRKTADDRDARSNTSSACYTSH